MSNYQRLSENPLDKAVRLVEFVRQTGGAPHLKHHGRQADFGGHGSRELMFSAFFFRKLNLLQYYCIDVMCASGIAAALVLYMVGKTASMIFHLVSALRVQKIKYE